VILMPSGVAYEWNPRTSKKSLVCPFDGATAIRTDVPSSVEKLPFQHGRKQTNRSVNIAEKYGSHNGEY